MSDKAVPVLEEDEVLLTDDAAKLLRKKPKTLQRWAREGQIPATKVGGEWYFRKSVLLDHLTPKPSNAASI